MSRLDRHVARVRNKLAISRFLAGLGGSLSILAGAVIIAILIDRLFWLRLPRQELWLYAGLGATAVAALCYAILYRPTPAEAAVAIDQRLDLKEKFSTALYVRRSNDPFAQAAVRDAETTAENVSLQKQFPIQFPRIGYYSMVAVLAAAGTTWLPTFDVFGRQEAQVKRQTYAQQQSQAREAVKAALVKVESAVPESLDSDAKVAAAKAELAELLKRPTLDPQQANRSALKALQDVNEAIKQQIKNTDRFATAQNDSKAFRSLNPASDEKGPVADARRNIASAKFDQAGEDLEKLAKSLDKLDEGEKKEAARQLQQMAQALNQMANDPRQQQQVEQKLQQMGASQPQAQQMRQLMQQAAQGDPKAQQQLQQMAQQMAQQLNNGQGPTPAQQAQMQQMMRQMQAQANTQAQAQAMQQAVQQMAQAMQNAKQGGQPNAQQNQQQMQQAAQAMQQQMQQMTAIAKDAEQMAAAQQAMQQAAQQQAGNCPGGACAGGDQPGQQQGKPGQGGWAEGDINRQGNGMGGAGRGQGGRAISEAAPFTVKTEFAPTQDQKEGQILASYFVKAGSIKGESKAELQQIVANIDKENTDEVDQDRIPRAAAAAVKEYFGTMGKDAK